jgi:hypothetical protein
LLAYPDEPDLMQYSRATKMLGLDEHGHVQPSGTILWIDAGRQWAVCDDGFLWTP